MFGERRCFFGLFGWSDNDRVVIEFVFWNRRNGRDRRIEQQQQQWKWCRRGRGKRSRQLHGG
jgi:hypothetical protein